jgi:hypothetical protein
MPLSKPRSDFPDAARQVTARLRMRTHTLTHALTWGRCLSHADFLFLCFSPLSSLTSCPSLPSRRSSAHFAAWHSPKREPEKFGLHFKLDDCRVWMRCAHSRADKMRRCRVVRCCCMLLLL